MGGIKVVGLGRLQAKLSHINASAKQLAPGINKATAIISGRAKANCPVDTGALRSSIHASPANISGETVTGKVSTSVEHAMYVEYGTGVKGDGSYPYPNSSLAYSSTPGQIAQPYLYPAAASVESQLDDIVLLGVKRAVRHG